MLCCAALCYAALGGAVSPHSRAGGGEGAKARPPHAEQDRGVESHGATPVPTAAAAALPFGFVPSRSVVCGTVCGPKNSTQAAEVCSVATCCVALHVPSLCPAARRRQPSWRDDTIAQPPSLRTLPQTCQGKHHQPLPCPPLTSPRQPETCVLLGAARRHQPCPCLPVLQLPAATSVISLLMRSSCLEH